MPLALARVTPIGARDEIGPTPVVYPDSAIVISPRVPLLARGVAPLLHHLHPAARIRLTVVSAPVIGRAIERLAAGTHPRVLRPLARLRDEVGAAAMIHPDALGVVAPRIPLPAFRVAVLIQQLHVAARVGMTVVTSAIIRRAAHHGIPGTSSARGRILWSCLDREVRAAAVIHPNPPLVKTPGVALLTG